jgi:hypothetical protein
MSNPGSYLLVEGHRLQRFSAVQKTENSFFSTHTFARPDEGLPGLPTTGRSSSSSVVVVVVVVVAVEVVVVVVELA